MSNERYPLIPVLIVDDEEQTLQSCRIVLRSCGINHVDLEPDSRRVLNRLESEPPSLILMDLTMPHVTGRELLKAINQEHSSVPVIVITGSSSLETAVDCMREGAFDYLVKPLDRNRLVASVQRALRFSELQRENTLLKKHILSDDLEHPEVFDTIISRNRTMRSIFKYVESIATTTQPVLIVGETGAGKELMANAIHTLSGRSGKFVPINVAGLDDTVFSDTLFGHKRGAFTGAQDARKGLIETAVGGTLFMDEIGDLEMRSQVKLLRLLQEREYYPLGADVPKRCDARIVVATNQDLKGLIKKGAFRKDLYFRLQTHQVRLPPLRERKEDLPVLIEHFLAKAANSLGKKPPAVPKELFQVLQAYHFPGNVRELESMVFDAVSKHESHILALEVFKDRIFKEQGGVVDGFESESEDGGESGDEQQLAMHFGDRLPTLKEATWMLLDEALRRADGNQTLAARMLGISQQAMSKRLKTREKGK
ncbi:MAG: sigma-54 dependent transcriptional regulator [Sumerlaeia bacterium]